MNEVDEYITGFPPEVQLIMHEIRRIITDAAPDAVEGMAYGMPGYKTHSKPLVYFAGYKKHIGFYATPTGHSAFAEELAQYKQGKGSVQFPLDKPIPYDLIHRIIVFRALENSVISNSKPKKS